MKRYVESADLMSYTGNVTFGGYIGSYNEYEEYARNEEEAKELIEQDAADDLTIEDIVQTDDDEWEVTVGFAGFIGVENTYEVYGTTEEEATEAVLEEARWDLDVEII